MRIARVVALAMGCFWMVTPAYAAFNDVTLTTDAVLSVNGITINVLGSSAAIQSITVNSTDFSFTLAQGSTIQISAPNKNKLTPSSTAGDNGSTCSSSYSTLNYSWTQSSPGTITVTPSTTDFCGSSSGGSGGSGGGNARVLLRAIERLVQ